MKTLIYLLSAAILIISGCNIDCSTFESKANTDWQIKQSEKYLKKAIEIDSNKMVAFGNYSMLINLINEFDTSRKQVNRTLKLAMYSMKLKKTSSRSSSGKIYENESLLEERATEELNKGSIALFEKRNPQKALRKYNRGIKFLPDDESLLIMRGLCKYELGNCTGAIEDWNRLKSLDEEINMNEYTARIENLKGYDELMTIMNK
jgi:tetratricopeptide (TPR) repeat protein